MTPRRRGRIDGRIRWHSNVVDDLVDCEAVKPHEQNPNNGDEDVVRESILTNGVYRHIYADRRTKRIVAGHTQYAVEIAIQLEDGIDRPVVPVSWVDGDNPQHVLKMLSVDNKAARNARIDDALQLDLLRDLDDLTGSGFNDDELDALIDKLDDGSALDLDDDTPEPSSLHCPKCGYDVTGDPEALRE